MDFGGMPKYKVCVFSNNYSLPHVLMECLSKEGLIQDFPSHTLLLWCVLSKIQNLVSISPYYLPLFIQKPYHNLTQCMKKCEQISVSSLYYNPITPALSHAIFYNNFLTKQVPDCIPMTNTSPDSSSSESINPFQYIHYLHYLHLCLTS